MNETVMDKINRKAATLEKLVAEVGSLEMHILQCQNSLNKKKSDIEDRKMDLEILRGYGDRSEQVMEEIAQARSELRRLVELSAEDASILDSDEVMELNVRIDELNEEQEEIVRSVNKLFYNR